MQNRTAARVVLLDGAGQVAIIHVRKYGYYKIPGGGTEPNEDLVAAAQRETYEESGCKCTIIAQLGRIITNLPDWSMRDISEGFLGKVTQKGIPHLEQFEQERDFTLEWFSDLDFAITKIKANHVLEPNAAKIQARDLAFLEMAKQYLAKL